MAQASHWESISYVNGVSLNPQSLSVNHSMDAPAYIPKGMLPGSKLILPAIYSGQSFDSKIGCIDPIECDTKKDVSPIWRSISHPDARIDICCDVALLVSGMKVP